MYIVFVQTRRKYLKTPHHRSATGLNHLAFHARSRKEVDMVTKELRARGTRILYEDDHPFAGGRNHYAVFFEDPDRIKVELVAPVKTGRLSQGWAGVFQTREARSGRSARRLGTKPIP